MNGPHSPAQPQSRLPFSLTELELYRQLFHTVKKRRKALARIVGATVIVMLVYVLIMPQSFTSRVTILPPQKEQGPFGLQTLLQQGASMPMLDLTSTFGFGGRPADLFVEILKSQAIADSLVVHENLARFFGVPEDQSYRHAIEPLQKATLVEINKNSVITLTLTLETGYFASAAEVDSVKDFTARVANQYTVWLDRINREKLISRARNSRVFVEEELAKRQHDLDTAYQKLVDYQKLHQSAFIDKQMEAALNAAAAIKGRISQAQVELSLKERDFSSTSRVIEALQSEIAALNKQYEALTLGKGKATGDYFVPFAGIPDAARDIANLLRDVKMLEQVLVFLSQQYYQDKVQEARETPTVQVLDRAMPALQRTSPHRFVWMVMTLIFSTLFGVLYLMVSEYVHLRRTAARGGPVAADLPT